MAKCSLQVSGEIESLYFSMNYLLSIFDYTEKSLTKKILLGFGGEFTRLKSFDFSSPDNIVLV